MDINQLMLMQIRERLRAYILREGFSNRKDFSVSAVVSPSAINKWEGQPHKKLFKAAQANDKSALEYLFYKMEPAIQAAFWRNFLGKAAGNDIRRYRISNENAWEDWLGIAWQALTGGFNELTGGSDGYYDDDKGALRTGRVTGAVDAKKTFKLKGVSKLTGTDEKEVGFDINKLPEDKLLSAFSARYKQNLMNAAYNANMAKKASGIAGISGDDRDNLKMHQHEVWSENEKDDTWNPDGDDLGQSSSGHEDSTFDEAYKQGFEAEENAAVADAFLGKWKQFCQDTQLRKSSEKKPVSIADVFFEAMDDPNTSPNIIAKKLDMAPNSVRNYMSSAQDIMSQYNITGQELMTAISKLGAPKVASYLKGAVVTPPPAAEEPKAVKQPTKKDTKVTPQAKAKGALPANTLKKFSKMTDDDDMWVPSAHLEPANVLYFFIKGNFNRNTLADKAGVSEKVANLRLRKALSVLGKYGMTEETLKKMVKQFGKKEVLAQIGDQS